MIWLAAALALAGWIALMRSRRLAGAAALAGAFAASIAAWGWVLGPVGWIGLLSATVLPLVLLKPYVIRPSGHRRSSPRSGSR